MFRTLKHKLTITAGKKLLNSNTDLQLDTGKRILSILVGAYIFQKGAFNLTKSPILAIQELALGSVLIFNGASGINKVEQIKPKRVSEVRKNQIQGNDPNEVPEFV